MSTQRENSQKALAELVEQVYSSETDDAEPTFKILHFTHQKDDIVHAEMILLTDEEFSGFFYGLWERRAEEHHFFNPETQLEYLGRAIIGEEQRYAEFYVMRFQSKEGNHVTVNSIRPEDAAFIALPIRNLMGCEIVTDIRES